MRIRDLLLQSIRARGVASLPEIVADITTNAECNQVLLRQTLARMVRKSVIERVGRGKYALVEGHELRSMPVKEYVEGRIEGVLRRLGGIAKTKEIHVAVWGRPSGMAERPYEYRLVCRVLKESPKFCQDFGRGIWNLGDEDRRNLPLLGRWAALASQNSLEMEFFAQVGFAFSIARDCLTVGKCLDEADIMSSIAQLANDRGCRAVALNHLRADADSTALQAVTLNELGSREARIGEVIYLLFERGDATVHKAAPLEMYEACARRFGVSAAALSRGVISPLSSASQALSVKCVTKDATYV